MRPSDMVNANGFRKFIPITVVAVSTLIQGILVIGCLVLAYLSFECNPSVINLGIILFFTYFGGDKCDFKQTTLDATTSHTLEEFYANYLPEKLGVAEIVYYEIILYGVISFLWIITSFLVLVSCLCKCVGRYPFFIFFTPWFIVVIAGCILDVAATILHIRDIVNTRSLEKTLNYLEIMNVKQVMADNNFSKDYLYLPIIVACLTSKLVILWLINLFGSFLVISQAKKIMCNKQSDLSFSDFQLNTVDEPGKPDNTNSSEGQQRLSFRGQVDDFELPPNQHSYEGITIETEDSYDVHSINLSKRGSILRNATLEDVRRQQQQHEHKTQFSYPNKRDSQSTIDDSKNRFSITSSVSPVSRVQSIKEKLHLTEELRSQLPWSYLNARNDIGTSIRALAHHEQHHVSPPVPVPDYDVDYCEERRPSTPSGNRAAHRLSALHYY